MATLTRRWKSAHDVLFAFLMVAALFVLWGSTWAAVDGPLSPSSPIVAVNR